MPLWSDHPDFYKKTVIEQITNAISTVLSLVFMVIIYVVLLCVFLSPIIVMTAVLILANR